MNEPNERQKAIQDYWTSVAMLERDAQNLRPTARDPYLQQIIELSIDKWLQGQGKLLDVGCGDGESTFHFAKYVSNVVGVDFIDKYVQRAQAMCRERGVQNAGFEVGNVLDLSDIRAKHGLFDCVTSIRCLINLDSWDNQAKALQEVAKNLRPGGLFLASEGWEDGFEGLDLRRGRAGLPPISRAHYNLMIPRFKFEEEVGKYFDILSYMNLGFYIYMSRVFQPVYVRPQEPNHLHDINRFASLLQIQTGYEDTFKDCDYAGIYVMRRRAL